MLQRFCICLSLLIISFHANAGETKKVVTSVKPISELVSLTLLEHCGMDVAWQKRLFVKDDEKINRMLIREKYLFVFTDHNYLYCIDRHKGTIVFSLLMAVKGLPVDGPGFYENTMFFIVGNKLHIVDMEVGRITKTTYYKMIGNGVVFPPVRNKEYVYVAGSNNRLSAMTVEGGIQKFEAASNDGALINSIVADDNYLIFSTETGFIIRIETDKPKGVWSFEVGGVAAPIVRDDEWIYVSSLDRKLHKLSIEDGKSGWLSSTLIGESLKDSVRIGKKVLYQYAGVKGLFAVDKDKGKKLWQVKEGFDLLCENGSIAYTLAKPSKLVVMDNAKGKKLYSVNFAQVSLHAANTEDSLIYVADEKGRIMCIKPNKQKP
ncbi:MAG: PQQ-binding-like beta-propeller repeat protein [Planctomycetes bacterium]|nr:PQQ-binding-like beta-propeller repeat protein [Planctomycetota bacterium]